MTWIFLFKFFFVEYTKTFIGFHFKNNYSLGIFVKKKITETFQLSLQGLPFFFAKGLLKFCFSEAF